MKNLNKNKLIAEFMHKDTDILFRDDSGILKTRRGYGYKLKSVNYDSSWSDLMPVVKKISKIDSNEMSLQAYHAKQAMLRACARVDFDDIYKSVVKFIVNKDL